MFSWYKYFSKLTVNLVFSHLGFWSGNLLFLIAPFPNLYLRVTFKSSEYINEKGDGSNHGFGYLSLVSELLDLTTWSHMKVHINSFQCS